ncbi:Transmembrane transcriptional regulator (anti-sigma factor RsiW) [Candidatus Methanophagaceae archaeon]|nr:Transmembrane transcriptional regulator (anti-sigma factor RsiW) [Methanophagales archaeon]
MANDTRDHPGEDRLHEYLDDILNSEARRELEAHTSSCEQCARELERLSGVFSELSLLAEIPLEADLSRAVLETIQENARRRAGVRLAIALQVSLLLLITFLIGPNIYTFLTRLSGLLEPSTVSTWLMESFILFQASIGLSLQSIRHELVELLEFNFLLDQFSIQTTHLISLVGGVFILWLIGNTVLLRDSSRYKRFL